MLKKMSIGQGTTFTEGWYLKLQNDEIPLSEKTLEILRELVDWAHQKLYFLSMDQDHYGNFDNYVTAFRLAQAQSSITVNNILIDTLQWG